MSDTMHYTSYAWTRESAFVVFGCLPLQCRSHETTAWLILQYNVVSRCTIEDGHKPCLVNMDNHWPTAIFRRCPFLVSKRTEARPRTNQEVDVMHMMHGIELLGVLMGIIKSSIEATLKKRSIHSRDDSAITACHSSHHNCRP